LPFYQGTGGALLAATGDFGFARFWLCKNPAANVAKGSAKGNTSKIKGRFS
jgi:hypothetical protein